jgi:hypothetical protein
MIDHHSHDGGHHHEDGECDTTGRHGMLLFGEDPLYLSHLAMYACPHHFQVQLEVGLDDTALGALRADRAQTGGGMYTVDPAIFPIAELDPHDGGPVRTSLKGTLVRGHFERGGKPIARDVRIDIRRVVRFRELDVDAQRQGDERLRYLCFGRAGHMYLVHELGPRPSFDQALAVRFIPGSVRTQVGAELDDDVSAFRFDEAQQVDVGRDDLAGHRLTAGEVVTGSFKLTSSLTGARGFTVDVEVERELYLEINELA